jgi:hypothetical protein
MTARSGRRAMTAQPRSHPSRINARLDRARSAKLESLRRTTRLSVSDVVRRGIDLVYEEVEGNRRNPLDILIECGFVGSGTGRPDLSERYKEELAEILAAKHGDR